MENRFSGGASGALGQGEGGPAIGEQPAAELVCTQQLLHRPLDTRA